MCCITVPKSIPKWTATRETCFARSHRSYGFGIPNYSHLLCSDSLEVIRDPFPIPSGGEVWKQCQFCFTISLKDSLWFRHVHESWHECNRRRIFRSFVLFVLFSAWCHLSWSWSSGTSTLWSTSSASRRGSSTRSRSPPTSRSDTKSPTPRGLFGYGLLDCKFC